MIDLQFYHTFNTFFDRWNLDKTPNNERDLIYLLHIDDNNNNKSSLGFLTHALLYRQEGMERINGSEAEKISAALSEIHGNRMLFADMDIGWRNSNSDSDFTHSSGSLADAMSKLANQGEKSITLRARYLDGPKQGEAITKVSLPVIRGEVATYAQSMMGWFRYEIKNDVDANGLVENLYIMKDAKIIRPHGIVGNLGITMGDHLSPFSSFLKELEGEVRGKKVIDAIKDLKNRMAADNKYPSGLIEQADLFLHEKGGPNLGVQVKAFSFLCWELIPSMVAIHNQALGAAFRRNEAKTKEALAKEAALVKAFLAEGAEELQDKIKNFISVTDYAPVKNPASITVEESIATGDRVNHIDALSSVMIDVLETFFRLYPIDAEIRKKVTEELLDEMLKQKEWVSHYATNPKDLGEKIIASDPASLQQNLQAYIIQHIKENSMLLADIKSAQNSPEANKSTSGSDVMDVDSDNNLIHSQKTSPISAHADSVKDDSSQANILTAKNVGGLEDSSHSSAKEINDFRSRVSAGRSSPQSLNR